MPVSRRLSEEGRSRAERHSNVVRSWSVARYLCSKGSQTTKGLALAFQLSERMITRIMHWLEEAGVPVYQSKGPGRSPLRWEIDVGKLLRQFERER